MSEQEKLMHFYKSIQGNPLEWAQFRDGPQRTMRRYGLSEETQELLREGSVEEIIDFLGAPDIRYSVVYVW